MKHYKWTKLKIKNLIRNVLIFVFPSWKVFNFYILYMFSCSRSAQVSLWEKPRLKLISLQHYKHWNLIHAWSNNAYAGTVVFRPSWHRGSLQVRPTVPLMHVVFIFLIFSQPVFVLSRWCVFHLQLVMISWYTKSCLFMKRNIF